MNSLDSHNSFTIKTYLDLKKVTKIVDLHFLNRAISGLTCLEFV